MVWGGGYAAVTDGLTEGPFVVVLLQAIEASQRLHAAIYRAAPAVREPRLSFATRCDVDCSAAVLPVFERLSQVTLSSLR